MSSAFENMVDGIAASAGAMKPRKAAQQRAVADGSDSPDIDALASRLMGPVVVKADRERRRAFAIELAAALLQAAGEPDLSYQVQQRA